MTEARRWLDESDDPLRRRVLGSAAGDGLDASSKRRIAVALGIGTAILGTAGTAATVKTVGTVATQSVTVWSKWFWFGIPGVAAVIATAGYLALRPAANDSQTDSASPAAAVPAGPTATRESSPEVLAPDPKQEPASAPNEPLALAATATQTSSRARSAAASPAPVVSTTASAAASASPESGDGPASADSIGKELARLEKARARLAANGPRAALAELDSYDRECPHGALRQESYLLRIEALIKAGDRASAQALGEQFIRVAPRSPYAVRVRRLLGQPEPDVGNQP